MELTTLQRQLLTEIYDKDDYVQEYYECFGHELRTAKSLNKRGFTSFHGDRIPENDEEVFMIQITKDGINAIT